MGSDEQHQLRLIHRGSMGAEQSSQPRNIHEKRNSLHGIGFRCSHQTAHHQNLVVFEDDLGLHGPRGKRGGILEDRTDVADFLIDFQIYKIIRIDLGNDT